MSDNGVIIKTDEEVSLIREASRRLAVVVAETASRARPGVTTKYLDEVAYDIIEKFGDTPAFLNYRPDPNHKPYPATICSSVNERVVHEIPKEDVVLKNGDIITIDCGIKHRGVFSDHAISIIVGEGSREARALLSATRDAMHVGIKAVKPGRDINAIGSAIERFISGRYGILDEYTGHGVGREIHEPPHIMNYDCGKTGIIMRPNMIFAIEPMITTDTSNVRTRVLSDGYTVAMKSGALSCMFEHTVLVTEDGYEILSRI